MADRLTQLQEAVNQLGEYFCNSIGVLQISTDQSQQNDSKEPQDENASLFSSLITRTTQDIEILINSLPSQDYTPDKQVATLKQLELENQQYAERLTRAVEEGEALLEKIRTALKEISDSQLGIIEQKQATKS